MSCCARIIHLNAHAIVLVNWVITAPSHSSSPKSLSPSRCGAALKASSAPSIMSGSVLTRCTVDGFISGHPKPIALGIVQCIRQAHWLVLRLGASRRCLRGLRACTLLLIFLGGAAFLSPVTQLATIVALPLASLSLPIVRCCGGEGFVSPPVGTRREFH